MSMHRSLDRHAVGRVPLAERHARYLDSPADALEHVAGYALSNDVSERDFQLVASGGQWSKGKSCETFQPLGPWLVTPDEIADVQALRLCPGSTASRARIRPPRT